MVHNYFLWMFLIIERIYDDRIPPKCPQKLRKFEKPETWKCEYLPNHVYKLFSVVHNYLLWMFLIIERKYVDRIPSKCPQKLRKCAKNEKLKMRISTKPFYKLFSVVHSNFQWMFLVIDRIYDDRIPPKCQKMCEKWKMRISTKPFYKLFSVVHNNFQWMCLIIERIYDDRIPPKCSQKLRKFAKNLKPENANIYQVILQTFQCGSQLLSMNVFNHWEEICWSYPSQMS